jgi:hypothetical protein
MNITYPVCECRFTSKALGDFIDSFGRSPECNNIEDCRWIGKKIDECRAFPGMSYLHIPNGRFAIVNYWKCRKSNIQVPLGGNKVGILPLPDTKAQSWAKKILAK